jgi:hypothetical protein
VTYCGLAQKASGFYSFVIAIKWGAAMAKRRRSSKALFPDRFCAEIIRWRDGDTTKPDPLFILVINNIALQRSFGSKNFVADMSTGTSADRALFADTAEYIKKNLFGELPGQAEKLLADSPHCSKIKFWSIYVWGLPVESATSLVGDFGGIFTGFHKPRRDAAVEMLANIGLNPDVVFIVTKASRRRRAYALGTTDDDTRCGIAATFDGAKIYHRFYHKFPGMVAIRTDGKDMTPAHEFGHAFSSYSNGFVSDLYRDEDKYCHGTIVLNRKVGRPIPDNFAEYHGVTYLSDKTRNSLGYGDMTSYHSELVDPNRPALMDRYFEARPPMTSLHDKMTKAYVMDRIAAKVSR